MKYLKRKIDQRLIEWKKDRDRKPLIVKGARQIGKTESVRRFIHKEYESVIEINFLEEPRYRMITENGYSPESIIRLITQLDPGKTFIPGKTVLFFDEFQSHPDIATSLKFFCQDGRFDVICSGSLLGVHYRQIESVSVGYKTDIEMQGLDFEEFLWAKGYKESIAEELLEHMLLNRPFAEAEMIVFSELFFSFCILGGMPAVVRDYIAQNSFSNSLNTQRQILLDYEEDIRKYANGVEQTRLMRVFRSVPAQLAKENKKFVFGKLQKGARSRDYWGCVEWLSDAGVVNICRCLGFPELPLKGNVDEGRFKLYYADTGLLVSALDEEAQENLRANRALGVYKGALYENFAAESFIKSGYDLHYYKRPDGTLEEDFFVRTAENLVPIEVKARNRKSQSLHSLIHNDRYADIAWGIKMTDGNIGFANKVFTFPYFCLFLVKRFVGQEAKSALDQIKRDLIPYRV